MGEAGEEEEEWEDGGDGRRYRRALERMDDAATRFQAARPKPAVSPLQARLQAAQRMGSGGAGGVASGAGGGGGGGEGRPLGTPYMPPLVEAEGGGDEGEDEGEVPSWLRPPSRPSSRPRSRSAHTPRGGRRGGGGEGDGGGGGTPYTPFEPFGFQHDDQSPPGSGVQRQDPGEFDRLVLESRRGDAIVLDSSALEESRRGGSSSGWASGWGDTDAGSEQMLPLQGQGQLAMQLAGGTPLQPGAPRLPVPSTTGSELTTQPGLLAKSTLV